MITPIFKNDYTGYFLRYNQNQICIIKVFLFFAVSFAISISVSAQNNSSVISGEIRFASYLVDNGEFRDAITVLTQLRRKEINAAQSDSIHYLLGWSYYNMKKPDASNAFLQLVSEQSVFYYKAKFYGSFNNIYSGKTDSAELLLNTVEIHDENVKKLKNFQQAGIALLERNYPAFDSLAAAFKNDYFPIAQEEKNLVDYGQKLKHAKRKSPLVAGMLSAILPGSGKFYAGYKGQAFGALIPNVTLGAVAVESYIKAGPKSARFIVSAGIFSLFYIGNIWGSAVSVKIKRNEFNKEMDNNIMLDIHIPLRRIFN